MQELFRPKRRYMGPKGNVGSGDTVVLSSFPGVLAIINLGALSMAKVTGFLANNANNKRFRVQDGSGTVLDTGANLNGVAGQGFVLLLELKPDGYTRLEFRVGFNVYVTTGIANGFPTSIILNGTVDNDIVITECIGWGICDETAETEVLSIA